MKIAIDLHSSKGQKSGVGVYIVNLMEHLMKIKSSDDEYLFVDRKISSSKIINFFYYNLLLPYSLYKKKVDIFHSPDFILPFIKLSQKYIITIHDLHVFLYPQCHRKLVTIYCHVPTSLARCALLSGIPLSSPTGWIWLCQVLLPWSAGEMDLCIPLDVLW